MSILKYIWLEDKKIIILNKIDKRWEKIIEKSNVVIRIACAKKIYREKNYEISERINIRWNYWWRLRHDRLKWIYYLKEFKNVIRNIGNSFVPK